MENKIKVKLNLCDCGTLSYSHRHPSASGQLRSLTDNPRASASGLVSRGPLSMSVRADCFPPSIAAPVLVHLRIRSGSPAASLVAVVWELFQRVLLASNCLLGDWSAGLELKCQALCSERQCEETLWRSVKLYWWEGLSYWERMIIMTACNYQSYDRLRMVQAMEMVCLLCQLLSTHVVDVNQDFALWFHTLWRHCYACLTLTISWTSLVFLTFFSYFIFFIFSPSMKPWLFKQDPLFCNQQPR